MQTSVYDECKRERRDRCALFGQEGVMNKTRSDKCRAIKKRVAAGEVEDWIN
jgi:hypothetical protein